MCKRTPMVCYFVLRCQLSAYKPLRCALCFGRCGQDAVRYFGHEGLGFIHVHGMQRSADLTRNVLQ